jgi:hypothetical protein
MASAQAPADPGAAWVDVSGSAWVAAGQVFTVRARTRNLGAKLWETTGAHRTEVAAMVIDRTGNPWTSQPKAGRMMYPVPPNGATTVSLPVMAPDLPGRYSVLLGVAHHAVGRIVLDSVPPARWDFEVTEKAR